MNPADLWETTAPTDDGPWPVVEAREHQLFSDVIEVLRPKVLVEFGSWEGASALAWAREARDRNIETKIICIDTWLGSPEHWRNALPDTEWSQDHLRLSQGEPTLINTFRNAVLVQGFGSKISPLRATSECGSEYLRAQGIQADAVYVDANHDHYAVANDLRFARSILSARGIIAGDDWAHPPIKRAVLEFALRVHHDILVAPGRVNFVLISR
ncbi:MAG: class I SAM-dependent methyltransferase, partial [Actinomycetota bacterium]|nr:class I SAM-dependent methyltransferase [Actinomycetota bacterium]